MTIPAAGVTPAGFFVPVIHVAPDAPVAITGDAIDWTTGDYLSIARGYDATDAAVLTALGTVRGSGSAVERVGHQLRDYPRVDDGLETFFREEVAFALRHLTESNQIRLLSVTIVSDSDWAEARVKYFNVLRGDERLVPLALSEREAA